MALTPGSAIFLDTNVLIYATFPDSPFHGLARARLQELEKAQAMFWTSRQVLREYLASTTRPGTFVPMPSTAVVCQAVRTFEAQFEIVDEDIGVTEQLLDLVESRGGRGKQVHDTNIVATMLRRRIHLLLTHNTEDFARYTPEITVLPLADPIIVTPP